MLLHVTSLPGPFGIGDLGPAAHAWVDQLAGADQRWWQILPLGPTGESRSPYQCFSAFAGNPLLISPEALVTDGLLAKADLRPARGKDDRVDYAEVTREKERLLRLAWENQRRGGSASLQRAFVAFQTKAADWLDDYALFMALRTAQDGRSWTDWPKPLVRREPAALEAARADLADEIAYQKFTQFLFDRQLDALREHARTRGVGLIGDIPIFVSAESSDVWTNPDLFELDRNRRPTAVAGVPPDMFSKTGQRWGNPLYDWKAMAADGYTWWMKRLRAMLDQADVVRLDHFRGFDAFWRVPASSPTAAEGKWVDGPGEAFFRAAEKTIGELPLIAEDLGVITERTAALRDQFRLPGMRVLQFAMGGDNHSIHLPHEFVRECVAYTGTHDNDTTAGWYRTLVSKGKRQWVSYAGDEGRSDPAWAAIRLAWASVAALAITPVQDVLSLPTAARMNFPGRADGNWRWRMAGPRAIDQGLQRLRDLTLTYGRDGVSGPIRWG